jgi:hypothetical protein
MGEDAAVSTRAPLDVEAAGEAPAGPGAGAALKGGGLGAALGGALGGALGDALGDAVGDALGGALGDAVGAVTCPGAAEAASPVSPTDSVPLWALLVAKSTVTLRVAAGAPDGRWIAGGACGLGPESNSGTTSTMSKPKIDAPIRRSLRRRSITF